MTDNITDYSALNGLTIDASQYTDVGVLIGGMNIIGTDASGTTTFTVVGTDADIGQGYAGDPVTITLLGTPGDSGLQYYNTYTGDTLTDTSPGQVILIDDGSGIVAIDRIVGHSAQGLLLHEIALVGDDVPTILNTVQTTGHYVFTDTGHFTDHPNFTGNPNAFIATVDPLDETGTTVYSASPTSTDSVVFTDYSTSATVTLTPSAVCFAEGSRLLTSGGDRAVEDLSVGDVLMTASGAARAITWIGQMVSRPVSLSASVGGSACSDSCWRVWRQSSGARSSGIAGACDLCGRRADPGRMFDQWRNDRAGRSGEHPLLPC